MKSYFWLFCFCFFAACVSNKPTKRSSEKQDNDKESIKCVLTTQHSLEKRRQMFPFNKAKKVLAIAYKHHAFHHFILKDVIDKTRLDTLFDREGQAFTVPKFKKLNDCEDFGGIRKWTVADVDTSYKLEITPNYCVTESITLNVEQIDSLSNLLLNYELDKEPITASERGCYMPRNGFLFLDSKDKVIAMIDICFECHQMYFSFNSNHHRTIESYCDDRREAIKSFLAGLGIKYGLETK